VVVSVGGGVVVSVGGGVVVSVGGGVVSRSVAASVEVPWMAGATAVGAHRFQR
jgi:hypothetical protein